MNKSLATLLSILALSILGAASFGCHEENASYRAAIEAGMYQEQNVGGPGLHWKRLPIPIIRLAPPGAPGESETNGAPPSAGALPSIIGGATAQTF